MADDLKKTGEVREINGGGKSGLELQVGCWGCVEVSYARWLFIGDW